MKNDTLFPCLTGQAIAQTDHIQPYFNAIKKLISAPPDIYDALYLTTLYRFSEFCQAMPFFMAGDSNIETYSLLKHQLNLAMTVLKLRRGHMLPPNSESETIAAQEALWTYALFTASLFKQIAHIQNDRSVELYKDMHTRLGSWHPLAGNLYEPNTYYQLCNEPIFISLGKHLITTLVGKIIPHMGLRWLADCEVVLKCWWDAILDETSENVITRFIIEAAEKIHYPLIKNFQFNISQPDMSSKKLPDKKDILNQLIGWLGEKLSENSSKKQVFRVEDGFFISLEYLKTFLHSCTIWPAEKPLELLIDIMTEFLIKEENNPIHIFRSVRLEDKARIHGIIIASSHLSPFLQNQPTQSGFMLDKFL